MQESIDKRLIESLSAMKKPLSWGRWKSFSQKGQRTGHRDPEGGSASAQDREPVLSLSGVPRRAKGPLRIHWEGRTGKFSPASGTGEETQDAHQKYQGCTGRPQRNKEGSWKRNPLNASIPC